jgi:ribosome-associated protein
VKINIPEYELYFSYSRSSGPGGQNVNKVNSKATMFWDYANSPSVSDYVKRRIKTMFTNHINEDGLLVIISQESRSQKMNSDLCVEKLYDMIARASVVPKVRKKSKPTRSSVEKRLTTKKRDGEIKKNRKKNYE